jgi:RNA polymerase sigma-70 factor, ECF subfamily
MTSEDLVRHFAAHRTRLRAIAYRMLGSAPDADDALQEAWLRASGADLAGIDNPPGWLTTVTARVCLDRLRARRRRDERPLAAATLAAGGAEPEEEAVLAEEVGRALLVVMDRVSPAERVAFVLHDLFAVPFEQVAEVVGRSPAAAKKLASRARHRVRGPGGTAPPERAGDQAVVEAFLAASRGGDLGALLAVLGPDVVRRADAAAVPAGTAGVVRGARAVAEETRLLGARARVAGVALVDGSPGLVVAPGGRLAAVVRVAVAGAHVVEVDVVAEPGSVAAITLAAPASPAE